MKQYKLVNIQKGYADVWLSKHGKFGENDELDGFGYVHIEKFVERSDFENDKVYYRTRWVPYIHWDLGGFVQSGKTLGYRTRKEAVEALVHDMNSSI